jgi:hypothetical protein
MHLQWTKITCCLLSITVFCETGNGVGFAVAFPVSRADNLPVSSQEEEEAAKPETNFASRRARQRTARNPLRTWFLPSHNHTIHKQSVVSSSQPLCERTRHKGVGTHLRR